MHNRIFTVSLSIIIAVTLLYSFSFSSKAVSPNIYSIDPNMIHSDSPTNVIIHGTDFTATSTVAVYGEEPYKMGELDTPGTPEDVFVSGDYAYIADGYSGLQIIDVTNPTNPQRTGYYITPRAYGVFVSGDYAYVAVGSSGLEIINILNPSNPQKTGGFDTPGDARNVFVSGDYAYIADGSSGLQIIDISNPSNPQSVGGYDTSGFAYKVFVTGRYAYIADGISGLQIIDISNPFNPQRVGSYKTSTSGYYDTSGSTEDVFVSGHYAYITNVNKGLQIIDISNPSNPQRTGCYTLPGNAKGVFVADEYAYIAYGKRFQIVNISNPLSPIRVGSYDTSDYYDVCDVFVKDGYAYIANTSSGLQIYNLTSPVNPQWVGGYDTPDIIYSTNYAFIADVFVTDNTAYIADDSGFQIIDILNPSNPQRVGSYDTYANNVFVSNDYAYIASGYKGLQIINITDPTNPQRVGGYDTPGNVYDIFVTDNYAYIADYDSGLQIISIVNPINPQRVGGYDTPGYAKDVFILDGYAYIADYSSGLQIIDISNPTNPQRVGSYDTPGHANNVFVSNDYAYIADGYEGLQIINITDPTNPQKMGGYDTPGYAKTVFVTDGYAYIADGYEGLQIINISDPTNPEKVGSYNTTSDAKTVFVTDGYAYIADEYSGLQIIDISIPVGPLATITFIDSNTMEVVIPSGLRPGNYGLYVTNPDGGYAELRNAFTICPDRDGDGFFICEGDCNDADPNIHPNSPELCDGKDNNCNGSIDEVFDLLNDPNNCGVCNKRCAYPHAQALCEEGLCIMGDCEDGWYDRDRNPINGCETEISPAVNRQAISLAEGWNLISFQINKCFYQSTPPDVFIPDGVIMNKVGSLKAWLFNDANSPIRDAAYPEHAGNLRRIISFDQEGAHLLDANLPDFINSLEYVSAGYGYWIKMNAPGIFVAEGKFIDPNTYLNLQRGWNLIGYISHNLCYTDIPQKTVCPYAAYQYTPEENILYCHANPLIPYVFDSVYGKIRRILSFDSCNGAILFDTQIPPFVNTMHYIGPKYGYWIKIEDQAGAELRFPYTQSAG